MDESRPLPNWDEASKYPVVIQRICEAHLVQWFLYIDDDLVEITLNIWDFCSSVSMGFIDNGDFRDYAELPGGKMGDIWFWHHDNEIHLEYVGK